MTSAALGQASALHEAAAQENAAVASSSMSDPGTPTGRSGAGAGAPGTPTRAGQLGTSAWTVWMQTYTQLIET